MQIPTLNEKFSHVHSNMRRELHLPLIPTTICFGSSSFSLQASVIPWPSDASQQISAVGYSSGMPGMKMWPSEKLKGCKILIAQYDCRVGYWHTQNEDVAQ